MRGVSRRREIGDNATIMPAFRSTYDLEKSLWAAGLGAESRDIAATVRPAILFVRQQQLDDPLPVGTSKIGGYPDLPHDFIWPQRPAFADAPKRAEALHQRGSMIREGLEQLQRDHPETHISTDHLDGVVARHKGMAAYMYVPMPLAFVAQINLSTLVHQAGFPADFPDTGLLSIFSDITGEQFSVHWHPETTTLERHMWPHRLVDYSDRFGQGAERRDGSWQWDRLTHAEVLFPFSALTVPHHWKYAFPHGSAKWTRVWDWFQEGAHKQAFHPSAELVGGDDTTTANFGDRLGGWPSDIQGNAEQDIDNSEITSPGLTPWRHLFSWGAESYTGTRTMPHDMGGDGNTFLILHEDDLAARHFDRVKSIYQQT